MCLSLRSLLRSSLRSSCSGARARIGGGSDWRRIGLEQDQRIGSEEDRIGGGCENKRLEKVSKIKIGLKYPVLTCRAQYMQFYFPFTNQSRVAFTTYYLVKTASARAVKVEKKK